MVNAQLDVLELELRKLQGVRTVGFSSQHNVLYIQLFVSKDAKTTGLPFEATRIAQRYSSSPVAVELVRWVDKNTSEDNEYHPTKPSLESTFNKNNDRDSNSLSKAGSISLPSTDQTIEEQEDVDVKDDYDFEATDEQQSDSEPESSKEPHADIGSDTFEEALQDEVNLVDEENAEDVISEFEQLKDDRRKSSDTVERIVLLTVSTSSENDEIEVHLAFNEMRTIGRAPTNRGLLGAIDATVTAIEELTGSQDFHAEWARTLEPGPDHASLVAIGLTNSEGTDTRHGIAGGNSPIEAASRATLNALNRITELAL